MHTLDIILGDECTKDGKKNGESLQSQMIPEKSKVKGTTERPATKRNNGSWPNLTTFENQRDEIAKKELGKDLETDRMKAVVGKEKKRIKEKTGKEYDKSCLDETEDPQQILQEF